MLVSKWPNFCPTNGTLKVDWKADGVSCRVTALEAYFRVGRYQKSRPPVYDYVTSLSEEDVKWLSELPYTISLVHLNALIVHAGLIPNLPLPQQRAADLSKLRNVIAKVSPSTMKPPFPFLVPLVPKQQTDDVHNGDLLFFAGWGVV